MHRFLALVVCSCLIMSGCGGEQQPSVAAKPSSPQPTKLEVKHLPNAYQIHPKVISGGLPEGDEAFAELEALGVKTVISVDGMKPAAELARKHGMRYVHLPHGYDGVPEEQAKALAKAVRDLDGPIYIHCHHGKHRSPAAATVACVGAGLISSDNSVVILKTAGTSDNYRGLYQSAQSARRLDDALLDALKDDFPETAKLPAMAEAMVAIETHHDHLKSFAAGNWQKLAKHPDLDPAHEALLLREAFTELSRTDEVQHEPQQFRTLLEEAEAATRELEATLRDKAVDGVAPSNEPVADVLARITKNCQACHKEFRDVPLDEKKR